LYTTTCSGMLGHRNIPVTDMQELIAYTGMFLNTLPFECT
jgi:hypothetical protein